MTVPFNRRETRTVAFYLPQYHPIPENDRWWGKGFTEWTNVAKAKPLFRGHYQPHLPADLGFYDLRVPETRAAQAEMAREYGISAFCYYHYWFAGKRLLERPFDDVLKSGEPDLPFCLCWGNQTWTGVWHGAPDRVLIEQTYPGLGDHRRHFYSLLPAFRDDRYFTVDGKPLFVIYEPQYIPEIEKVIDLWRKLAQQAGLKGLYMVGFAWIDRWPPEKHGFDASLAECLPPRRTIDTWRHPLKWLAPGMFGRNTPTIYDYGQILPNLLPARAEDRTLYPCVIPNWDNTPRCGVNGLVFQGSTPDLFRLHLEQAIGLVEWLNPERRLLFIKSWNEWAEGNHLEPDQRFGTAYLQVLKDTLGPSERSDDRRPAPRRSPLTVVEANPSFQRNATQGGVA